MKAKACRSLFARIPLSCHARVPWLIAAVLALVFSLETFAQDEVPPSYPIELPRQFELDLKTDDRIDLGSATWLLRRGDDPAWATASLDPSAWKSVDVGMPLAAQGHPNSGFYWYRTQFQVPEKWESDRDFLLDLGRISVFDQVFLNGEEVGHYSNLPPAPPEPGSSGVRRRYLVRPSLVHFGAENVLAVRVRAGGGGGLYEGPYAFSALASEVSVNFALKAPANPSQSTGSSRNALLHFLTPATHQNQFYHGDPVRILPEIAGLSIKQDASAYRLKVRVEDSAGKIVFTESSSVPISYRRFTAPLLSLDLPEEGSFTCTVELNDAGGKNVWSERLSLTRKARPERIDLPVDPDLRDTVLNWNRAHRIHKDSVGHYGGRAMDATGTISLALTGPDPRGALTYNSLVDPGSPGILIFQTNLAPAPRASKQTPTGNRYDGYDDVWPLGYISTGLKSAPTEIEVDADWTKRRYDFHHADDTFLQFTNSTLSPAYRLRTNSDTIEVFQGLSEWGLGQPTQFAFASSNGIAIRSAAEGVRGAEMEGNWILAWFHGSKNWDSFDMPWLFILENRPSQIRTQEDAFQFKFAGEAGHFFGMPLFGVRTPTLYETESWTSGLPREVIRASLFWSSSLLRFPELVERDFAVDFAEDSLTVQDRFEFSNLRDAWNTAPSTDAPLSPTLALSAQSGNLDIAFDRKVIDPMLPTLHGPLLIAHNTDTVRFRIRGIVHYMRQERTVSDLPTTDPVYQREKQRLEEIAGAAIENEDLNLHPWERSLRRRSVVAGYAADLASHLLLALPFLSEELQEKVTSILLLELRENFLFTGIPDERMKRHISKPFWKRPVMTELVDQSNGLPLAINSRDAHRGGLDGIVMESFRLHAIWQIADTLDAWQEVEENWALIQKIFNLIPHSHDWAINQSWDTFSGVRIGNGLQESGVIFAALLGVGRMANHMGERDLEEYAACLAAMQAVSLNAAATGIHYIRRHRPWSADHSEAAGIAEVERKLRERYVEFNEFAGSSQNIINARDDAQNPYSYILWGLPDTTRPYHDLWPEANRYFFEKPRVLGSVRRPLLDVVAYVQQADPEEIRREFQESLTPAYQVSPYLGYTGDLPELVNTRVYLESLGTVDWVEPDAVK